MTNFMQQIVSGLASGGIYGLLALAIVLIHRSTGVINFAQGEMATLSAFLCWTLVSHGWSFWPAFGAKLLLSFGPMTLAHALARLVMAEQIYRAVTILTGHPYHAGH